MANKNFKARVGIEAPLIAADNGTTAITLSDNDVTVVGDLTITSNTIKSSTGATAISLSSDDVTVADRLFVVGNIIGSNGGYTALTFNQNDVKVEGDLTVNGNDINSSSATAITLSGTDVTVVGDLAVNGGDITTTQTTASVFNTTATTLNIGGAATAAVNIGTANGSILKGPNRSPFTSPTITAFTGSTSPSRGLLISNGNGGSAALARNALVLRTYPTSGGARGQVLFENARGTENVPTAVQSGDLIAEINATGYATNGFLSDYIAAVPALSYFTPTETWANTGGPYPTAGTVTNAGTGYVLTLQPSATNLSAGSRITVLTVNPQTFSSRSDAFTWANGKTGTTQTMSLDVSGNLTANGKITASGANTFDSITAIDAQSNLLNTNNAAGTSVNIKTNYWTSSAKTTRSVPQTNYALGNFRFESYSDTAGTYVLGSQVSVQATENFTATANGTKIVFTAVKQGKAYNDSSFNGVVLSASPDTSTFSSDVFTFQDSASPTPANYATLNSSGLTLASDLRVNGNDIRASDGSSAISLTSGNTNTIVRGDQFQVNNAADTNFITVENQSGKVVLSINQRRATSASDFATANWTTQRSTDGINYTPTLNNDVLGEFKFNGNAYTSTSPGNPGAPGGNVVVKATENWSSTANGTAMLFLAIKQGTLDSYGVFSANPSGSSFTSDSFTFNTAAASPVTLATVDSTAATFTVPVGFPVKTAAQWNAITGAVGRQVCVSDSGGGSNPNGMMAFWDTTHSRWSYIHDNTAV